MAKNFFKFFINAVSFEGITVPTAEHLYQALKFKRNPDGSFSPIQREILEQATPYAIRLISRQYTTTSPGELVVPRANVSTLNHNIEIMRFILRKNTTPLLNFAKHYDETENLLSKK